MPLTVSKYQLVVYSSTPQTNITTKNVRIGLFKIFLIFFGINKSKQNKHPKPYIGNQGPAYAPLLINSPSITK